MFSKLYKLTLGRHNEHTLNSLPKEITYCGHPTKEEFLEKTRTYVSQLMEAANPQNAPMLMVDQLVPPSEIWRYLPFFDDIRGHRGGPGPQGFVYSGKIPLALPCDPHG